MPQLGVPELLIILVIIIAIFGAGKLANVGGAVGKAVHDFRQNVREEEPKPSEAPKAVDAKPVEAPKAASATESESSESESASA